MTFIAYLLTIILVPTIAAIGLVVTFPLMMLGVQKSPRLISTIQGIAIGVIAAWGCQTVFSLCGVAFSNTPLWLMAFLFFLNDWNRMGRSGGQLPPIGSNEMEEKSLDNSKMDGNFRSALINVGHLIGTPIGFLIFANFLS
jgi:hypothetical protein